MSKQIQIKTVVHLPTQEQFDEFFEISIFEKPKTCGCKLDQWEGYRERTCYDLEKKDLGAREYYLSNITSFHAAVISFEDFKENQQAIEAMYVKQILVKDAVEQSAN